MTQPSMDGLLLWSDYFQCPLATLFITGHQVVWNLNVLPATAMADAWRCHGSGLSASKTAI
jgi:hypothetical protein